MPRMLPSVRFTSAAIALLAGSAASLAQDSVALTPGGNDALSAYDAASQRVRYAVDLVPLTTSWNNPILVGPVMKASRDTDPMFRTQILGSIAASPSFAQNTSFASRAFSVWSTPGGGVHPTANSAGSTVNSTGFRVQFGVGLSDFSLSASNVAGAVIGRESGNFNRLLVERVVGAASRSLSSSTDTSTVSLGGIDALGTVTLRADGFNAPSGSTTRLLGDNILSIALPSRSSSVNTLFASGSTNLVSDTTASTFIVSNEANPTNTPTIVRPSGSGPFGLIYDFAGRFRTGSATANLTSTTGHLPVGILGHRGNPTFSPATPLVTTVAGNLGTVASIGADSATAIPNRLIAFGLNAGAAGAPPVVAAGSSRVFTLPTNVTNGTFTANTAGNASFRQYLSQTAFRGGNGQVAIGTSSAGLLMLAAVATDPTAGEFIAVATANSPSNQGWTIAAHPGMTVRNGLGGTSIGTLTASAKFSAPAMDRFGNVYFIANWQPSLAPAGVGLFKAVNTGSSYQLELLLSTGQQIAGANSARTYTVTSLALTDSDSVASGSMFAGSVIQERDPLASGTAARSIRAFGGAVVSAVITYDNAGTSEAYDAVLFVGPQQGIDCAADYNGVGGVTIQDIFDFLNAWFASNPNTDFNGSGSVTIQDIFDFLNAWFAGC